MEIGEARLSGIVLLVKQKTDELTGLASWQSALKHAVDHAENRSGRSHTERQRQHRHGREARSLQQHPQSVAQVLPQRLEPRERPQSSVVPLQ